MPVITWVKVMGTYWYYWEAYHIADGKPGVQGEASSPPFSLPSC